MLYAIPAVHQASLSLFSNGYTSIFWLVFLCVSQSHAAFWLVHTGSCVSLLRTCLAVRGCQRFLLGYSSRPFIQLQGRKEELFESHVSLQVCMLQNRAAMWFLGIIYLFCGRWDVRFESLGSQLAFWGEGRCVWVFLGEVKEEGGLFFPVWYQIARIASLALLRQDWIWRSTTRFLTTNTSLLWTLEGRRIRGMDAAARRWWREQAAGVAAAAAAVGREEAGCPAACRSRPGGSHCCLSPSCSWPGWLGSAPDSLLSSASRASFTSLTPGKFVLCCSVNGYKTCP